MNNKPSAGDGSDLLKLVRKLREENEMLNKKLELIYQVLTLKLKAVRFWA